MIYVARKCFVYHGSDIVARAVSKEFAKRIARALNKEKRQL
jgi:hypothetical protein